MDRGSRGGGWKGEDTLEEEKEEAEVEEKEEANVVGEAESERGRERVEGGKEGGEEGRGENGEEAGGGVKRGCLAGNATVRRHTKYRRPRDAGRQYTTPN